VSATDLPEPRILARSEHPVSRSLIDKNALKVLYRLQSAGYKAYLVGGGVRDLMLGRKPKDFDVATDARPNEIRRVFRNARIIGRRFRLAHVLFAEGVVEVSTFRRIPLAGEAPPPDPVTGDGAPRDLLITSDNTFGNPREDAFRRDFTVNVLFYNIADFSVIDYTGGVDDLQRHLIRAIGDPDVRFQEDPVRMLRACEFAARLGFGIEHGSQEAIERQKGELRKASPARLTEELLQLLRCGKAGASLQWMLDLGLLSVLLPEAYAMLTAGARGLGDFGRILPALDTFVAEGREMPEIGLLASLLLPGVLVRRSEIEGSESRPISRFRLQKLIEENVAPFFARFTLSQLKSTQVVQAILAFSRMCEPAWTAGERVRFASRPSFADGLWLFELLVEATGEGGETLASWRDAAQMAKRHQRHAHGSHAVHAETAAEPARRPRRRRRRR